MVRVRNTRTGEETTFENPDDAAEHMGLDVHDLNWAIEEFGHCDGPEHVAWNDRDPEPPEPVHSEGD